MKVIVSQLLKISGETPPSVITPQDKGGGGGLKTNLTKVSQRNSASGLRTVIYLLVWKQM